jgi:hypothetical protein
MRHLICERLAGSYANLQRAVLQRVWRKADTWLGIVATEHAKAGGREEEERQ